MLQRTAIQQGRIAGLKGERRVVAIAAVLCVVYLVIWVEVSGSQSPSNEMNYTKLKQYVAQTPNKERANAASYLEVQWMKLYKRPEELQIETAPGQWASIRLAILAQVKAEELKSHAEKNARALQLAKELEDYAENVMARKATKKDIAALRSFEEYKEQTGITVRQVSFKLNPSNGSVYYISAYERFLLSKTGKEDDLSGWYQAPNNTVEIYGLYYFAGKWGDNVKVTGKVLINGDVTIPISSK